MTDREKELERLLREVTEIADHAHRICAFGGPGKCDWCDPEPVAEARTFLASPPAQEEKRYTLAEVEAAWDRAHANSWEPGWDGLVDALKETP